MRRATVEEYVASEVRRALRERAPVESGMAYVASENARHETAMLVTETVLGVLRDLVVTQRYGNLTRQLHERLGLNDVEEED